MRIRPVSKEPIFLITLSTPMGRDEAGSGTANDASALAFTDIVASPLPPT